MAQHVTVVYYSGYNNSPDAFHVMNINRKDLQGAFNEHDISSLKCITIEMDSLASRSFKTLFMESDIQKFVKKWGLDF